MNLGPLPPVTITIHPKVVTGRGRLRLGVTHTQKSLDTIGLAPDAPAIARAKRLLGAVCTLHNVHLMGWGTDNPNPAPGVYDWASLDRRMAMVRSIRGAVPVITLCAAPDWMKGGEPNKTVWQNIEVAPLPEHYEDFARLAARVARRYPDVRYFQVWNEMKGLWKRETNNWDYENYTRLYNLTYDALKAVNPAIKVGGPYLVVEGTGGGKGPAGDATGPPLSPRNRQVLDYWMRRKKGADFLVLDRALRSYHDRNVYTPAETMRLTRWFGEIARQVRALSGGDLPLWWAEYYGDVPHSDPQTVAAVHASILAHMVRSGAAAALLWQPMESGEVPHALFTDARRGEDGARPLPYLAVFAAIHDHFGPGTPLVKAFSSSPDVEVLASPTRALLINKGDKPVLAKANGTPCTLAGHEVRLIAVPPGGGAAR